MILSRRRTRGCQALPALRMSVCQGTTEQRYETSECKDIVGIHLYWSEIYAKGESEKVKPP